ncbi:MAG: SDR family oxidoreductase [Lachnospiraceae bacterium]|jgi:NAD(P)-dependent dehydrogenase (short-subunit alcohol dehydrogenase family)|nr:SDR family oxidoreductase [Lachnospiraceae bacterium]
MRLAGKVAIVTGASSGIGAETAKVFAQEGAKLLVVARRKEKLEAVAKEITDAGGTCKVFIGDVTKEADCIKAVEETIAAYGQVDVLVNNAGIADKHRPIDDCSSEWWDHVILTDQTSVYYMSREALKYMVPQKSGSIVNIASIGARGLAGISYSAAKAAVISMSKNIALEFAPIGIRCNTVSPGPTPTELNTPEAMATFNMGFADHCAQHMNLSLPESNVNDQAKAILFFASDDSKAVTGQDLIVDHGTTL